MTKPQRNDDADQPVRRITSTWPAATPTVAVSAFDAGRRSKPVRRKLDLSKIEVRVGVPVPAAGCGPGGSAYAELWARLPVGGMVEVPERTRYSFCVWARKAGHAGCYVARKLDSGQHGIWRLK
jgi:hypothetical protein